MITFKRLPYPAHLPCDTYTILRANPGSYMRYAEREQSPIWPIVISLSCGHLISASRKVHAIQPDGAISPSIVCPYKGCSFHDFGRLEDWEL